jgi:hypothetical protein
MFITPISLTFLGFWASTDCVITGHMINVQWYKFMTCFIINLHFYLYLKLVMTSKAKIPQSFTLRQSLKHGERDNLQGLKPTIHCNNSKIGQMFTPIQSLKYGEKEDL